MITQLLVSKGFAEGVDFSFDGTTLVILPQIRMEGEEEVTWYADIPNLSSLKKEIIISADATMVISKFLEGKQRTDSDSINVDLFLNGGDGWRFANIPAPTIDELYDLVPSVLEQTDESALIEDKKLKGRIARQACENVLDLIGGFNIDRELTFEQKNEMKTIFANAKSALNDYQPSYAKYFINLITPDGVLVTNQMKALCLKLLEGF